MQLKKRFKIITSLFICFTFLISFSNVQINAEETISTNPYQKALFNALLKSAEKKSFEKKSTTNLSIELSDFDKEVQSMYDMYAPFLQNMVLENTTKTTIDDSNLKSKSENNFEVKVGDVEIPLSIWSDINFSEDKNDMKIIFSIPEMLFETLPQLANKKYLVLDYFNINDDIPNAQVLKKSMNTDNYKNISKLSSKYKPKFIEFAQNYLNQFNPSSNFVTSKGLAYVPDKDKKPILTQCYEIKINDAEFKNLIKYTINNLLMNDEGIELIKDYIIDIMTLTNESEVELLKENIDNMITELKANRLEYSIMVNSFIDMFKDIKILGDKGISTKYYVNLEGSILKTKSIYDFQIDLSQFIPLINMSKTSENTVDIDTLKNNLKGIIKFSISSVSNNYNINGNVEIEMPEITEENSINYWELILNSINSYNTQAPKQMIIEK